jgi:hypothetical protein
MSYDEHQAMWPQMIAALAAIDDAIGIPADDRNSIAQTLAKIRNLRATEDKCNSYIVDNARLAAENKKLRHLLFVAHGNAEHYLYGDDGERSCNTCMIDFNRDSAEEIERKIHERIMLELAQILPKWAARIGATPPSKAPEEPPAP